MSQPTQPLPDHKPAVDAPTLGLARAASRLGDAGAESRSKRVIPLPPPRPAPPQPPPSDAEPGPDERSPWFWWLDRSTAISFLASFVFHLSVLLVLAILFHVQVPGGFSSQLMASIRPNDHDETLETVRSGGDDSVQLVAAAPLSGETLAPQAEHIRPLTPDVQTRAGLPSAPQGAPALPADAADLLLAADTDLSGMMSGRAPERRAELAASGGGSVPSEEAVERGLRWLTAHQLPSGAWRFDLEGSPCQGMCRNPGRVASTTAATALALLPYLGAGYTHQRGEYQDVVRRGLFYLVSRGRRASYGLDFQEGTMYGQGLAAIALCEAYAMTGDEDLKIPAQKALNFIVWAQDKQGGGWRYDPGKPGDTTVTGWQLMALKSGQMAKLIVPSSAIGLVKRFLDGVQSDGGARYGYMTPEPRPVTTAVGLLIRMYTGWGFNHPAMYRGVDELFRAGPSPDDIYYNFYAAQVLHHWGGPQWDTWNRKLRDELVRTQATQGHEAGSWHFANQHGDQAGRLYTTAMAVMTLEVYYRFLPLYGRQSLRDNW